MKPRVLMHTPNQRGHHAPPAGRAGAFVDAVDEATARYVAALAGHRLVPVHVTHVGGALVAVSPASERGTETVRQYAIALYPPTAAAPVQAEARQERDAADTAREQVTAAALLHELHELTEARRQSVPSDAAPTQQQHAVTHHRVQWMNRQEMYHDDQEHS